MKSEIARMKIQLEQEVFVKKLHSSDGESAN